MISFSNKHRSTQPEIMDDLDFHGNEMKNLLKDLKTVNKWLGGNKVTLDGLRKLLKNHPKNETIVILDIGCGDGELLRRCVDFGERNNFNFKCIGLDFNENILKTAEDRSLEYKNISFIKVDVLQESHLIPNCDITLCTLFLHHFTNENIDRLINVFLKISRVGIVINDLERSKHAFNLFKLVSEIMLKTTTARHDGLVSIARGFKKNELFDISNKILNQQSTIHWRWAYRFQWILKKTN